MNDSDLDLLNLFVSRGDQAAFAALVARHRTMVEGICRRVLSGSVEIDDAVQATFVALSTSAPRLVQRWSGGDSLCGWLHRVATNAALELRRQDMARRRTELAFYELQTTTSTHSRWQQSQWEDLLPHLDVAIESLPERFQGPLVLCYLEGRTQEHAAVELGITFGTLRRRLQRAKSLLQSRLTRRNAALTAMGLHALLYSAAPAEAAPSTSQAATQALVDAVAKLLSAKSDLAQCAATHAISTQAFSAKGLVTMLGCAKGKAIAAGLLVGALGLNTLHGLTPPTLVAGSGGGVADGPASDGGTTSAGRTTSAGGLANTGGTTSGSGSNDQVSRQQSGRGATAAILPASSTTTRRETAPPRQSSVARTPSSGANAAAASAAGTATGSTVASAAASSTDSSTEQTPTSPSYQSQQKRPGKSGMFFAAEINDNGVITRFNDPADAPKVRQFMLDKLGQFPFSKVELPEAVAGWEVDEQLSPRSDDLVELADARSTKSKPKANTPGKSTAAKSSVSQAERDALRKQKAAERLARRRRGGNSPSLAGPGGNSASAFSGQINDNGNVTNFTDPAEAQRAMQQLKQKFPQLQQFNFDN